MAVLYSSRMETLSWFISTSGGTPVLKSLWGIDSGNAMTCCQGELIRNAQPTYATELHQGTIRWQYAFLYTSGSMVATPMIRFRVGSAYNIFFNPEFSSVINLNANGSISFYIAHSTTGFPGETVFTSAPGVFALDGTYHAFQMRFDFSGHTVFNFEVLINNVSVLNDSCMTTALETVCDDGIVGNPAVYRFPWTRVINPAVDSSLCSNQAEIAGINDVCIFNRQYAVNTMSSWVELIIDDSKSSVSYLPGNASRLKVDTCTTGTPDPPVGITEVRVTQVALEVLSFTNDNSGLYFPNPTPDDGRGPGGGLDVPHDNYINRNVTPAGSIERKIPDPTIKTALIGE